MTDVEMLCEKSVPGCADCAAEEAYKAAQGHSCGPSDAHWSTLCEVVGHSRREDEQFHRLSHQAYVCQSCGAVLDDHLGQTQTELRDCPSGECTQIVCMACGTVDSSFGEIDCPSCGSLGRVKFLRRMHHLYRRRRGGRW